MERKVVLITGGSSGIGLAAAKSLLDRGCLVYEISRREHSENGIVHIGADVTDEAAVTTAVDRIIQETGADRYPHQQCRLWDFGSSGIHRAGNGKTAF